MKFEVVTSRPRFASRWSGFTLIEMMITVVIIAILASIAYPSYAEYVAKGRRADARVQLLAAQQWMERFYSQNYSYVGAGGLSDVRDRLGHQPFSQSPRQGGGAAQYTISLQSATATDYTLVATRVANAAMASDACGNLSLNHLGVKSIAPTGTGSSADPSYSSTKYSSLEAAVAACWR